jgi:hypothetical protein
MVRSPRRANSSAGYYLVDAKDLDAATGDCGADSQSARVGSIEVRPIWVYNK